MHYSKIPKQRIHATRLDRREPPFPAISHTHSRHTRALQNTYTHYTLTLKHTQRDDGDADLDADRIHTNDQTSSSGRTFPSSSRVYTDIPSPAAINGTEAADIYIPEDPLGELDMNKTAYRDAFTRLQSLLKGVGCVLSPNSQFFTLSSKP